MGAFMQIQEVCVLLLVNSMQPSVRSILPNKAFASVETIPAIPDALKNIFKHPQSEREAEVRSHQFTP